MTDLDEFLNSVGMAVTQAPAATPTTPPSSTPSASLSPTDFDEILEGIGFPETTEVEAEEIQDDFYEDPSEDEGEEEEGDTNEDSTSSIPSDTFALPALNASEGDFRGVVALEEDTTSEPTSTPAESPVSSEQISSALPSPAPLITPNSPTLLIDDSTSRFSGTEWYHKIQEARIILAGVGGIGSNVAFQLARMAPASMVLYDYDIVETVNIAGQLYSHNDIGRTKVDAIGDMIRNYTTATNVFCINDRFGNSSEAGPIMICGFDNMAARKDFFAAWMRYVETCPKEQQKECLFLDGRLSIDTLQIFCITGDNNYAIQEYQDHYLFSDREADPTVCSMKQTTYLACMIGSLMVNLFTNFIANSLNPILPYDLPFFTEYDAQNMIFKTAH